MALHVGAVKVENSHITGAEAAGAGSVVAPKPSSVKARIVDVDGDGRTGGDPPTRIAGPRGEQVAAVGKRGGVERSAEGRTVYRRASVGPPPPPAGTRVAASR